MKTFILVILSVVFAVPCGAQSSENTISTKDVIGTAQSSVGMNNIAWGVGAASQLYDGSYNLCLGKNACPTLTRDNCIIDIVEPTDEDATLTAQSYIGNASYAIALAKHQDYVCKDNQNRYEKMHSWFVKLFDLQIKLQEDIHEKQRKVSLSHSKETKRKRSTAAKPGNKETGKPVTKR
jgi:hypothetical protein